MQPRPAINVRGINIINIDGPLGHWLPSIREGSEIGQVNNPGRVIVHVGTSIVARVGRDF